MSLSTAIIGMIGVSSALIGYLTENLNGFQRVLLFVGGLLMIYPGLITDAAGLAIIAGTFVLQRRNKGAAVQ